MVTLMLAMTPKKATMINREVAAGNQVGLHRFHPASKLVKIVGGIEAGLVLDVENEALRLAGALRPSAGWRTLDLERTRAIRFQRHRMVLFHGSRPTTFIVAPEAHPG